MKKIILASGSPRRKELLGKIGLKFEAESSNYEEDIYPGLQPHDVAQKRSLKKAEIVAGKHKNAVIIAADTFIVFDGQILGKPSTANESRKMLEPVISNCCNARVSPFFSKSSSGTVHTGPPVSPKVIFLGLLGFPTK